MLHAADERVKADESFLGGLGGGGGRDASRQELAHSQFLEK